MKKNLKRYLACFMALAVLASYSFSPQNLTAFAVSGNDNQTVAAQEETEQPAEPDTKATEETKSEAEPSTEAETQTEPAQETEEATEPTEATTEEADEYPATSFTKTAGKMTVRINAPEGALPEGATVKVVSVKAAEIKDAVEDLMENGKVVKAVDITFYDKEGKEIEPKKEVSVSFAYEKIGELDNASVIHINNDGEAEKVDKAKINTNTNKATFKSDDFSIYAIVTEGEDARILVKFVKPDGSEIASMYVKDGDNMEQVLYDPGAGELAEDVYFRGWTTEENYTPTTTAKSIADVRTEVADMLPPSADGTEVTYYAMLFKYYRITYFDGNNISLGQEEVAFRADSTTAEQSYKVNMGYTVQDDTHHFEGWNVLEGGSNIQGHEEGDVYENNDVITITGDVQFGVNAPEGHWFIFNENGKGATYNAPQFIQSGEHPTRPNDANMIRNGYTFGGWFADKAVADQTSGGTQYNFNQPLTDKVTVYARWIPKTTANYTVIIWKQNLAADGYDFTESISLSGNVGATINTVSQQNTGNNAYARINGRNYQYTGFHLDRFDQNIKISTEGNSVVNVYYNRNEYTLTFNSVAYNRVYNPSNNDQNLYGYVDNIGYVKLTRRNNSWQFNYNGTWYSYYYYGNGNYYHQQLTQIKSITALYQQPIGDNFPITGSGVAEGTRWSPQDSTTFSNVLVYIDIMPAESVTFFQSDSSASTKYMEFYVEALPGQTPDRTWNQRNFVKYGDTIPAKYNYFTEAEDFLDLTGYTKLGSDPAFEDGRADVNDGGTIRFYYTRNTYTVNFMDGKYVNGDGNPLEETSQGQIHTESGISYGASISSFNNYEPDSAHTPKGYVFEGWYIDSECTQPYTFDKMPEGGVTVYAKWRQKQYRVFLHVNYPEGATGNINWGSTNQAMNFRISEGGHVSEPTGRDLAGFDFVGWYLDEACTEVFNGEAYVINEDNVTTPYDKTVDMTDTYDNNGNLIDPKSNSDAGRFWITKKLDIYAKWRTTLEGASGIVVQYDANGGTKAPTDPHTYVDKAKAPAGAASKPPAESNKVFGYWVVQKWENGAWTDTNTKVYPGGNFEVLAANAKVEDIQNPTTGGDTKKYIVQLKAVYIDSEQPTPTHIYWYKNVGDDAFKKDEPIDINVGVNIPTAPTRDGYNFLGWSRVDISTSPEPAAAAEEAATWEANSDNWTQDLSANDVYISYVGGDNPYKLKADNKTVTQVAADEDRPYQAMFAVWEEKEVTINYAVAEDSTDMGAVDPTSETVKVETGNPSGSTATAASSTYVFDY